jgi:hypothetical protein
VAAQAGSEPYVEALAQVVFYWAYPGADAFGRTNIWQIMAGQRGGILGVLPARPKNHIGGMRDYMGPSQRWVVTPNNDTIYGAGSTDLTNDAVVIQTPTDSPEGLYWTIQITDVLTNVWHQLGSASKTSRARSLLVARLGLAAGRSASWMCCASPATGRYGMFSWLTDGIAELGLVAASSEGSGNSCKWNSTRGSSHRPRSAGWMATTLSDSAFLQRLGQTLPGPGSYRFFHGDAQWGGVDALERFHAPVEYGGDHGAVADLLAPHDLHWSNLAEGPGERVVPAGSVASLPATYHRGLGSFRLCTPPPISGHSQDSFTAGASGFGME